MLSGLFSLEYVVKIGLFGNCIRIGSPQLMGELIYARYLCSHYGLTSLVAVLDLCLHRQ